MNKEVNKLIREQTKIGFDENKHKYNRFQQLH